MTLFQKRKYDLDEDGLPLMNCMTVIAGKKASATGRVLVGHNEDDKGNIIARHTYVPPMDWPEGTVLPAEEGCASIPQVAHTYGYYWTQLRTEQMGLSSSDMFYNEKGVYIASNSMGTSHESMENPNCLKDGGIAYNLRRVLAERSASARDGVRVLIDMVMEWGYAPSGRAYTIADKDEAFMIQVVHGRHYIGGRVPDDHVVLMPNYYNFHTLHDCPEMFYSPDLVEYALAQGWYQPAREGDYSDFDFTKAYQLPEEYLGARNTLRQYHAQRIARGRDWDVTAEGYRFSIPGERPMDVAMIQEILSSHYEGTADLNENFGSGRSPHDTVSTRFICTGTTLESQICAFEDDPLLTTLYCAYGRPCQLPYVPVHPLVGAAPALEGACDPRERMAGHLLPEEGALAYRQDTWHRLHTLESAMEMTYSESHPLAIQRVKTLLQEAQQKNAAAVQAARQALAGGQVQQARELLQELDGSFLEYATGEMEHLPLRGVSVEPVPETGLAAQEITLRFVCDQRPLEDTLVLGFTHTHVRMHYAPAVTGSVKNLGEGRWEARFLTEVFRNYALCPGDYEFFLGGRTPDDKPFFGRCIVPFVS